MRIVTTASLAVILTLGWMSEVSADAGVHGLRVLSTDPDGVTVEYILPDYSLVDVETSDGTYTRISVPGLGALAEEGKPELPAGGTWVAVPATGRYTLRLLEQETETVPGHEILPVYRATFTSDGTAFERPGREYFRDESAYATSALYPTAAVRLDGEAWMRFQRVANIRIQPIQYNASGRTLTVSKRLVFRIDFAATGRASLQTLSAQGLRPAESTDRFYEGIYRGAIINYEQGRSHRARPMRRPSVRPSGVDGFRTQAIGTGNPEWKVKIDTTGVWKVEFSQLSTRGFPAGFPIDEITAFVRDTTVNLQPEPWVIREIPIDVIDLNGNSQFDAGDFLVLPVQDWAERVQAEIFERFHGNADVVWISYKTGGSGLRVRNDSGWLAANTTTTPPNFPSRLHLERDFFYLQFLSSSGTVDQFHWTTGFTDGTPIDTLFADLMDLDPSGADIQVDLQWVGNTRSTHTVSASWVSGITETPLITDVSFSSQIAFNASATLPANAADPGVNRLKISGSSPGSVIGSGAPFNWFEVVYPRNFVARNDRLLFNSGGSSDTVQIFVDGFTGVTAPIIYLYDVTDWSDPARVSVAPSQVVDQGGTWQLQMQTVVPAGSTSVYYAASDLPRVPDSAITSESPSSLYLTPSNGADFIIIAYDTFADACEPLADFRRSQGITTLVAKAQDVYDEFNGGRKSHFAIRSFLRYALENWGTRFVLFVGDASEDARGVLGTSDIDYLPVPTIKAPVPVSAGRETAPSDNWYTTKLTGDGGVLEELLVDIVIGRWTSSSVSQVQAMVAKSLAYETPPFDEPWRNRAVLIADDEFSTLTTFGGGGGSFEYCQRLSERVFKTINQEVESMIRNEGGFRDFDIVPFYLSDKLASLPTFPGNCVVARDFASTLTYVDLNTSPELFVQLNSGAAFVNYQGHGNATVISHEEVYIAFGPAQDIDLIFNDGKPWVFTGFACHLNSFAGVNERRFFGDGLGERMVNEPGKGAIASFASTAFELLPFSPSNHLNVHFHRAFFVDPPYERFAGRVGARILVGEAATLGVARMVASTFGLEQKAALTYMLLGDPLAAMNFGAPRIFASAVDDDSLRTAVPYFPTVSGDTVSVTFDVLDESFLETLTINQSGEGASGAVPDSELTITPDFPDTTSGKRYEVVYKTAPRAASYDITVAATDRTGLTGQFVLRFELEVALTLSGQIFRNGDPGISPSTYLWKVRSPARLTEGDFEARIDDTPVSFKATRSSADTSGRIWDVEFFLDVSGGNHALHLDVAAQRGGATRSVTLNFDTGADFVSFDNVYSFPNPFREFTTINFNLLTNRANSVLLRVYTVAGRLVYEREEQMLVPGYYQWKWDGLDRYGARIAFGTYLFRLAAITESGEESAFVGRLVRAPIKDPEEEEDPLGQN